MNGFVAFFFVTQYFLMYILHTKIIYQKEKLLFKKEMHIERFCDKRYVKILQVRAKQDWQ